MRVAIDTNILVYAFIRDEDSRHALAADLLIRAALADAVLPAQVLGEFINVIRRKFAHYADDAAEQMALWSATFGIVPTTEAEVLRGARFAVRHQLQSWDAIIWQASVSAGADYLLSEDLHNGLSIEGLTAVDPFNPANGALIDALLTPMEGSERP
ncbi:MAG: PIN domain-containing protein [Sphingomicrobium sp.]